MGVPLKDVFTTLQVYLGGYYTNDFNKFGRTWQVNLQADPGRRLTPDDVKQLKVRNAEGKMVPLGSIANVYPIGGPVMVTRYNGITAAAINGHSFGAAAMLAMAHDFRVMRTDRGYFCFPEVDIHIPFTPGMAALIQAKLTPQAAVSAMTTGSRFGGSDAAAIGIVDVTAEEDAVVGAAINTLARLGAKDPGTLGAIKSTMFATAVAALTS